MGTLAFGYVLTAIWSHLGLAPIRVRPCWANKKIQSSKVYLNNLHALANLDIHQCLQLDNFILVKYDGSIRSDTTITITTPRRLKDVSKEFHKPLQSTIRKIKQKYELPNDLIRKLKKDIKKLESNETEISEQITHIENITLLMKEKHELEKVYRRLMKNYQAFYDCLNDNLLKLEEVRKHEIKTELKKLEKVIQEYRNKL